MLHNTVHHIDAKKIKFQFFSPTRVEQRKSTSPKNGEMRTRLPVRIKNEPGAESEVGLDSSENRPFCKLCGITPDDLEQHMLLRHREPGQPRFYCNVCDKNYTVSPKYDPYTKTNKLFGPLRMGLCIPNKRTRAEPSNPD